MREDTVVDLLRHGEPVGGRRYRGQTDDPLSEKGWAQMWAAVGAACPWTAIVTSPLSRCRAFAEALAERHGREVHLEPRFQEIAFGEWEGRTSAELTRDDPHRLLRFWDAPEAHRPPGAEPLADFERRVVAAWEEVLRRFQGRHVLVVGHAGMMRMVVRHALDMPRERLFRLQIPNAGLTRIRVREGGGVRLPTVEFHARLTLT
ncbi:alpha-ribazole phosphatase family protein [Ectothiorhodospiraceae bacterium 2226]|nr:alpha-ribazole phosphatase family protein [Ectothiorhodospiraceae bacterium 2226]